MDDLEVLTELNFSSVLLSCLLVTNKINEAHSFMNYLKETKVQVNFLTYLKYMALCGKNVEQCGQDIILQTFQKVKFYIDSAPVLDLKRAELVIRGISATNQWRMCFDYLRKFPHSPNMEMKNCLAIAAIKNSDESFAWEIITKWFKGEEKPSDSVFHEFVKHALRLQLKETIKSEIFIVQLFEFIQVKGVILSEKTVKLIEEYFRCHTAKWNISYTKVNRSGNCESCKTTLKLTDLSSTEFAHLRNSFLERSVKKTDLFINTTQREFDQFIKFIDTRKPFHMVLDGLNAAYTVPKIKTGRNLAVQLLKVVEHLSEKPRKLLVLGRSHMSSWQRSIINRISQRASLFLTSDISQDDPFLVYAALTSGPHCYIVSSDLMRDHMARLDDPVLISLFKRWQQTHQIYLIMDDNGDLRFIEPLRYSINIQGSMKKGWHIPYDDKIILEPYEELNNWLCITKGDY